jgi:nucleotide-binding universal stress UspA family protein
MPIKSIVVSLNDVNRLESTLGFTVSLAKRFEAHVMGVYVIPAVQVYPSIGFEAVPQVFDGHRVFFKEREASVQAAFENAMKNDGREFKFESVEAREPSVASGFLRFVRRADLAVVSVPAAETSGGIEADFIETILMSGGRPVIALPREGSCVFSPDHIVVGWNGAREATRAVFDALPLLRLAETVRIVIVDPQKDPEFRDRVAGINISEAMSRHGIRAVAESYATEGLDHGEALLRKAKDTGAGMIVMGAYGHSRLAEFVFGGATRFVLDHLDRPVLFSH